MSPRHLVVAAAVAALGCQPAATGPGLELSAATGEVDRLEFTLRPPTVGDFSRLVLERRQLPGDFLPVADLPPAARSHLYTFPSAVPELTDHEFRLRALPEPDGLRASPPVAFHRGLRAPQADQSYRGGPDLGRTLHFTNTSFLADAMVVSVQLRPCGAPAPPPEPDVALPPDSTAHTWQSPGFADGAVAELCVAAGAGQARSAPRCFTTGAAPLLAPSGVALTQTGTGARLDFVNQSRCATQVELRVAPILGGGAPSPTISVEAPPPGGASALVHGPAGVGLSPGLSSDEVCARAAPGLPSCTPAGLAVVAPTGLLAWLRPTPVGAAVVRTGDGGFATASGAVPADDFAVSLVEVVLRAPGPLGEDELRRPRALLLQPNLVVDPAGHPHALLQEETGAPAAPTSLVHAWHDGTAWQVEEVARGGSLLKPRLAVGPDGTLHAAWITSSPTTVQAASRSGGAWALLEPAPFQLTLGAGYDVLLAGDAAGAPHVVITSASLTTLGAGFHHGPAGWSNDSLAARVLGRTLVALRAGPGGPGGAASLVGVVLDSTARRIDLVEWGGGAWSAPTTLANLDPAEVANGTPRLAVAASADGARLLVVMGIFGSTTLQRAWLRDGPGVTPLRWFTDGAFAAGFDAAGKAWLLERLADAPAPEARPSILFEEP